MILAYHAVAKCPRADDPHALFLDPELFERQMDYLARTRTVVSLDDATSTGGSNRGRPRVAITFDDGYRSLIEHAVPILEHHGFPAAVFVPTAVIGDRNRWDAPSPCGLEIMSRSDIGVAQERGVSFHSHGHHHLELAELPESERRDELTRSIEVLEDITGTRPRFLAYPYGASSPAVEATVADLGFEAAFTLGYPHAGQFAWARVPVARHDPAWLLRLQTRGMFPKLRYSPLGAVLATAYRVVRRPRPKARA